LQNDASNLPYLCAPLQKPTAQPCEQHDIRALDSNLELLLNVVTSSEADSQAGYNVVAVRIRKSKGKYKQLA
jgi:hypothetical protein